MRLAAFVVFISGSLPCWAADRLQLTITAVSHDSQVRTNTSTVNIPASSNTSCNGTGMSTGPMSTAQVNCNTTTSGGPQTVTTSRLDVENVVESNGERFIIRCTGSWVGTNCSPMRDGDTFQAEYDGKTTMWVSARRGGNLGKAITVKYRVVDRRPIPTATATSQARASADRADAEFVTQLQREFPELAADSDRVSRGLKPESELFNCTGEIYRSSVALDPALKDSKGALLMAARQAKAELKTGACAAH